MVLYTPLGVHVETQDRDPRLVCQLLRSHIRQRPRSENEGKLHPHRQTPSSNRTIDSIDAIETVVVVSGGGCAKDSRDYQQTTTDKSDSNQNEQFCTK